MSFNFEGKDWLLADDSSLPTNQLPLLRSLIGKRLSNIQRFLVGSVAEYEFISNSHDFFRKGDGPIMLELEGISPIYFQDYYSYHWDEKSIAIGLEPLGSGIVEDHFGMYRRYTLQDREYVDERLHQYIGRCISKVRILIRRPEVFKDVPRALQDGVELSFDNETVLIISYYLNKDTTRILQILYHDEIRWDAVQYTINVEKEKIPWRYRFNRWKWRALDRIGRRLGFEG